jgi:hypothetical protein
MAIVQLMGVAVGSLEHGCNSRMHECLIHNSSSFNRDLVNGGHLSRNRHSKPLKYAWHKVLDLV